ncbi:MAG: hypothetical protein GWO20_04120, partial [Candidatus Korarchaeota archaeon]|nr:hypothetical protein [Candidatus Korarchaeota archaeon]
MLTDTGNIAVPLRLISSSNVEDKTDVTAVFGANLVFHFNSFSHPYEGGNIDISLNGATIQALQRVTKLLPLAKLKGCLKYKGGGSLNTGVLREGAFEEVGHDFYRLLFPEMGVNEASLRKIK